MYAFVRHSGSDRESAKDLTQEFFGRMLERRDFARARREKGRFRSYLLVALKHFLANEWRRGQTRKRGGSRLFLPLDEVLSDGGFEPDLADSLSADKIFDRRWALTLLDQVLARLKAECCAAGKARQFELLRGFLTDEFQTMSQAEAGRELGLSEGAVKQAVHRLRRRYRRLLRDEIARTLSSPKDVEDELRHLVSGLRS